MTALITEYQPEEWGFFVFIFASVAVFTGSLGSYGAHWAVLGAAQVFEIPFTLFALPAATSGIPLLALAGAILFVVYLCAAEKVLTPGLMAVVYIGALVLALGA